MDQGAEGILLVARMTALSLVIQVQMGLLSF
jgi:hypothetical protein